jgi:hypothetical protein
MYGRYVRLEGRGSEWAQRHFPNDSDGNFYRLDDHEWLFLLAVHHIIFDGPSIGVFFSELQALCEAEPAGMKRRLPPLATKQSDEKRYVATVRLSDLLGA